jgi:hypothetical protein
MWHTGTTKDLTRPQAVEEYLILRLRVEEIRHLDYLLLGLKRNHIALAADSPYSTLDLANTVRTCFMGWFATLTDKDERAVYAFDCLFTLFPKRRVEIGIVQQTLEVCHRKLQAFRNNVAFHVRSNITAHVQARMGLRSEDSMLDIQNAIRDFKRLMESLISEELTTIPEMALALEQMHVNHMPAFSRQRMPFEASQESSG